MNYELIKILCKRKNISTNELCNEIGYTEPGFYRMLKEETLKVATLEKISTILNVNPGLFFKNAPFEELANEPEVEFTPKSKLKSKKNDLEDLLKFKISTLETKIKELEKTSS